MENLLKNNLESTQIICQYLISGKTIYYSDNVETRLGFFSSNINSTKLHEFGYTLYNLISNKYEIFKNLLNLVGYDLIRANHTTLSNNQENKYYFYLNPVQISLDNKPNELYKLNQGDILLISLLIIESNKGSIFLNCDDFIDRIVNETEGILKINIEFNRLLKIISPMSKLTGKTPERIKFLKEQIKKKILKLSKFNFIHIIQNNQKIKLISLGPSAFRFTNQMIALNTKNNSSESEVV